MLSHFLDSLAAQAGVLEVDRKLLKEHLGSHDAFRSSAEDPSWRAPLAKSSIMLLELVEDWLSHGQALDIIANLPACLWRLPIPSLGRLTISCLGRLLFCLERLATFCLGRLAAFCLGRLTPFGLGRLATFYPFLPGKAPFLFLAWESSSLFAWEGSFFVCLGRLTAFCLGRLNFWFLAEPQRFIVFACQISFSRLVIFLPSSFSASKAYDFLPGKAHHFILASAPCLRSLCTDEPLTTAWRYWPSNRLVWMDFWIMKTSKSPGKPSKTRLQTKLRSAKPCKASMERQRLTMLPRWMQAWMWNLWGHRHQHIAKAHRNTGNPLRTRRSEHMWPCCPSPKPQRPWSLPCHSPPSRTAKPSLAPIRSSYGLTWICWGKAWGQANSPGWGSNSIPSPSWFANFCMEPCWQEVLRNTKVALGKPQFHRRGTLWPLCAAAKPNWTTPRQPLNLPRPDQTQLWMQRTRNCFWLSMMKACGPGRSLFAEAATTAWRAPFCWSLLRLWFLLASRSGSTNSSRATTRRMYWDSSRLARRLICGTWEGLLGRIFVVFRRP